MHFNIVIYIRGDINLFVTSGIERINELKRDDCNRNSLVNNRVNWYCKVSISMEQLSLSV